MITYVVNMTEAEMKLFSEFLEQREYTGPVKKANEKLRRQYEVNQAVDDYGFGWGKYSDVAKNTPKSRKPLSQQTPEQKHISVGIKTVRGYNRQLDGSSSYRYGQDNLTTLNARITSGKPTDPSMLTKYKSSLPKKGVINRKPIAVKRLK